MRAHLWGVVVVVAAVGLSGCKKDKHKESVTPTPTSPLSTKDQDQLWALAPDGASVGYVMSPKGVARIEGLGLEINKLAAMAPELARLKSDFDKRLEEALGTSNPTLADAGLSGAKGAALFTGPGDKDSIVIAVLADRERFLAVTKGTKGADGLDTVGKAFCKAINGFYACTRNVALFDRLGTGKGVLRQQLIDIAGARGDIEVTATIPAQTPLTVSAVVQMDRGTGVMRGAVKGVAPELMKRLGNAKPRTEGDNTAGFGVVNVKPMLANVPAMPIAPGVAADELARSIDGPITLSVAAGSTVLDIRVPLNDPAPAQKLIDQCDTLGPLRTLGATVANGTCTIPLPQVQTTVDAWIDGKQLRIGQKQAKPASVNAPMSAVGKELAGGEWIVAMFGRGTMFTTMKLPPIPVDQLPPVALAVLRAAVLVNEVGFGVRVDGDKIRFLVDVRTAYANPDDVLAKHLAIQPKQFFTGEAGTQAKQIAEGAPSSPFAGDFAAGYGGLMVPAAGVGMLAAIAIPAFKDYIEKSKRSDEPPPPAE